MAGLVLFYRLYDDRFYNYDLFEISHLQIFYHFLRNHKVHVNL